MLTIHRSRRALVASAAVLGALASAVIPASASQAAGAKGPVVSTAKTSLGRILVDAHGHTLYLFAKDRNGKSACSGACAAAWPPLIATAKPRAGAGAEASRLGTTRRRRAPAGDLQPSPGLHVRQGHQEGPDQR